MDGLQFAKKIENSLFLRSYEFLDVTIEFYAKNHPKGPDFQPSTTLGGGVNKLVYFFGHDFGPKMTFTKKMVYENDRP